MEGRANNAAARFDPFEGMPTYSQRYIRKRRKTPKLDTRPYGTACIWLMGEEDSYLAVLKFFPKELWSTLDPLHSTTNGATGIAKPRKLLITASKRANGLSAYERELSGEPTDRPPKGEDDDEPAKIVDEDDLPSEEDVDDEYGSDEDEMAGDYNAEQYFDDGGDDAGEDYDAGEADGGEYGD